MRSSWCRAIALGMALVASLTPAGLFLGVVGRAAAGPAAPVLVAVGDIDGCHEGEDTAELAAKIAGPIATVGDNAYPGGSDSDFAKCYEPTWGALKDRAHPVPGNHDYDTAKAAPYYEYFGAAAGDPSTGWYSYDVGTWHVVALNSNCSEVDCSKESGWLEADLAAHPSACILAYWHHPRFTSGTSGGDEAVGDFWKVLYDHRASLVLSGHDHDYERFAPQDPSGRADRNRGIRQFVVGTGGATLGSFARVAPNSEVRNNRAYGVLQLTLRPDGYDWRFVATEGDSFTDAGSDTCRGTAPAATAPPPTVEPAAPPAPPDPAEPPSGPSDSQTSSPPATTAPADPPTFGRRRPTPAPIPQAPASPRPATGSAKPPATRAPAATAMTNHTQAAPVAPTVAPAPAPPPGETADSTVPPATVPAVRGYSQLGGDPGYSPPAGDPGENAPLALAISGLIDQSSPSPGSDRRSLALVALAFLVVDGAGLAALRRRR